MTVRYGLIGGVLLLWGGGLIVQGHQPDAPAWMLWLGYALVGQLLVIRAENFLRGLRHFFGFAVVVLAIWVIPPACVDPSLPHVLRAVGLIGGWIILHEVLYYLEARVTGRLVRIFPWLPGLQ